MVSRQLHIAASRIRSYVRSREIYDGQTGTRECSLRLRLFPLPIFIPQLFHINTPAYHRHYIVSVLIASLNNRPKTNLYQQPSIDLPAITLLTLTCTGTLDGEKDGS